MDRAAAAGEPIVLACSALKHAYQEYLAAHAPDAVRYVYLHGSEDLIRHRLEERTGHFMGPGLVHSQFEALEPPEHAVRVDVSGALEEVVAEVRRRLGV